MVQGMRLRSRSLATGAVAAMVAAFLIPASQTAEAAVNTPATAASIPGAYQPVAPTRLLDTRHNTGATGPVAANGVVHLQVTGGVVPTGASAVVVNVTVTAPAAAGNVTVYPDLTSKPTASNLNFVAGQTIPNLVVVGVGTNGKIALANNSPGTVQLIADVSGYYLGGGTPAAPGAFKAVTPTRVLDTRHNTGSTGPVASGATVHLQITGGVVPSGASAVVVNVTVTQPTRAGNITVYPDLNSAPTSSNLNFVAGQTIPNLVEVGIGSNGKIALTNNSGGTVQLLADIAGYYIGNDTPTAVGAFQPVSPTRVLDTRHNTGATGPVAANGSVHLAVTGGAVPVGASAVVVNVTVTAPAKPGNITVYPDDSFEPTSSNLNFVAGQTIPNLVVVGVAADGKISLTNNSPGTVQLIADISGYYIGSGPAAYWHAPASTGLASTGATAVSCATEGFCAAVDASGQATTFNGAAWATPSAVDTGHAFTAVSCATSTSCVAVDNAGRASFYAGTGWSAPAAVMSSTGLTSISCVLATFCMAVDATHSYIFGGSGWSGGGVVDSGGHLTSVSCNSDTACVAVDPSGKYIDYNGETWTAPATVAGMTGISVVSCGTPSFCAAATSGGKASTFNTTTWTAAKQVDSTAAGTHPINSISCTSATFCMMGDQAGYEYAYSSGTWDSGTLIADESFAVGDLSCSDPGFCVAVGAGKSSRFGFDG